MIINVFGQEEKDYTELESVTYYVTDDDSEFRKQMFLDQKFKTLGIYPNKCFVEFETTHDSISSTVTPKNDPNDYNTVWSSMSTGYASGYAGGQPAGGVMITTGGSINYVESGGGNVSVSFAFGGEFGSVSVSVPIGSKVSYVTGYSVNIPSTGYWKLYVTKTYHAWAYKTYKKVWQNDMIGYEWVLITNGVYKELYSINLQPIRVS